MAVLSLMLALLTGCYTVPELGDNNQNTPTEPPAPPAAGNDSLVPADDTLPIATIVVKDYGTIVLELYPDVAPQSVYNFISLARAGFYEGLTFHRVMSGFMIQGGDPNGDGTGGPGYNIKGEFAINGIENNLSHKRGVISMARRNTPYDSAGSQFFIVHQDNEPSLDGKYAAFGRVISGMDVVDAIAATATNRNDKPLTDVVIESVTIDGPEYPEPEKLN